VANHNINVRDEPEPQADRDRKFKRSGGLDRNFEEVGQAFGYARLTYSLFIILVRKDYLGTCRSRARHDVDIKPSPFFSGTTCLRGCGRACRLTYSNK
jgi:hypothetical protein